MFIKLMILVVALACVAPFFIKGPGGKPLMTIDKLLVNEQRHSALSAAKTKPEKVKVYKWKDKDGVWQFSNMPVDVEGVQVMELEGAINIMPAATAKPERVAERAVQSKSPSIPSGIGGISPDSISPEKVKQAMETATHLQETIDKRKEDIDEAIGQ